MKTEGTNLLVLTMSVFWSSSRWPKPRWAPEGREVSRKVVVIDRFHCTYIHQDHLWHGCSDIILLHPVHSNSSFRHFNAHATPPPPPIYRQGVQLVGVKRFNRYANCAKLAAVNYLCRVATRGRLTSPLWAIPSASIGFNTKNAH